MFIPQEKKVAVIFQEGFPFIVFEEMSLENYQNKSYSNVLFDIISIAKKSVEKLEKTSFVNFLQVKRNRFVFYNLDTL